MPKAKVRDHDASVGQYALRHKAHAELACGVHIIGQRPVVDRRDEQPDEIRGVHERFEHDDVAPVGPCFHVFRLRGVPGRGFQIDPFWSFKERSVDLGRGGGVRIRFVTKWHGMGVHLSTVPARPMVTECSLPRPDEASNKFPKLKKNI